MDSPGILGEAHPDTIFLQSSKLHLLILDLEDYLSGRGYEAVTGLISGCCKLCDRCPPLCRHPHRARSSLEAVGINVIDTCKNAGMPLQFPAEEVVRWTGMLLARKSNRKNHDGPGTAMEIMV